MFKISIHSADGKEMHVIRGNFMFYKNADGQKTYWDWKQIARSDQKFGSLFSDAEKMLRKTEEMLPDLTLTGGG